MTPLSHASSKKAGNENQTWKYWSFFINVMSSLCVAFLNEYNWFYGLAISRRVKIDLSWVIFRVRPTRPARSPACAHHSLNNPAALHYKIHNCHVALLGVTTPYGPEIIQAGSVLVSFLCIANTAEPPVSAQPKCKHLVVALNPGGGTAIYGLYRYVPLWRVCRFSSSLL